jgi:hypothetical protein
VWLKKRTIIGIHKRRALLFFIDERDLPTLGFCKYYILAIPPFAALFELFAGA